MDERDEIEPAEIYVLAELEAVLINRNFGSNGWGRGGAQSLYRESGRFIIAKGDLNPD